MRNRIGRAITSAILGMAFILTGCDDRAPTGQVLASVGGDDITKRDLDVEAALTHLPPGPVTLNAIVDRKLLVRRAKRERLEQTPDYLAAMRRFREATLATLAVQEALNAVSPASDAAVRDFARARDWQFADRHLVEVDDHGTRRTIDTATLTNSREARRLLAAGVGARVTLNGQALRIISSRPIEQSSADRLAEARRAYMQQRREAIVRQMIEAERASVRVRYQSGFGTLP